MESNEFQNFKVIIRSLQNVNEKRLWSKKFKDLANFFEALKSTGISSSNRDRLFDETLQFLEKIFGQKLYKPTIENLIDLIYAFFELIDNNGSIQHEFFAWLFNTYFDNVTSDENKLIILQCLATIIESKKFIHADNFHYIQIRLKKALESTNNVEIVIRISQLMIITGKRCPNSLRAHIKNLIDILLGWYIDGQQMMITIELIEDVLDSLDIRHNIPFSFILLSQFMEDFEKFFLELINNLSASENGLRNGSNRSMAAKNLDQTLDSQIHKMTLRIRIFVLFYRKIFIENRKAQFEMSNLKNQPFAFCLNAIKVITKVVLSLQSLSDLVIYDELLSECNRCIPVLIETIPMFGDSIYFDPRSLESTLFSYCDIFLSILDESTKSKKLLINSLIFLRMVVKIFNENLPTNFVEKLFQKKFQSIKFILDKSIQTNFIQLYYSILRIKSVSILDQCYKFILKNLQLSFASLIKSDSDAINPIIEEKIILKRIFSNEELGIDIESDLNRNQSSISIYIDLLLLAEIANTKHTLIAMLALSPNFIELMLYHLNLSSEWLLNNYPSLFNSMLFLFISYCKKHHCFISQSSLFASNSSPIQSDPISPLFDLNPHSIGQSESVDRSKINQFDSKRFQANSHASNYFVDILQKLISILSVEKLPSNLILLCLRLIEEMIQSFNKATAKTAILISQPEFINLLVIVSEYSFANHQEICQSTCEIMRILLSLIDDSDLFRFVPALIKFHRAFETNLPQTNVMIQNSFLNLSAYLPHHLKAIKSKLNNHFYSVHNEIFLHPEEIHLALIGLMNKQPLENFTDSAFNVIIEFIQQGTKSLDWIVRTFYTVFDFERWKIPSHIRSKINYHQIISINQKNSLDVFKSNYTTMIFWLCYEFVQFCIKNRLKTPLGKPQNTFTEIESIIKMFINEMTSNNRDRLMVLNGDKHNAVRIRMLLMILDNFEKLIYNTVHGDSLLLYAPSKSSKLFFNKNKATCSEWINRNRRSIMVLARKISQPTTVIHHGQELLLTFMNDRTLFTVDEIEFILLLMIDALISLKAPDTIMNYYIWAKKYLNVKLSWIKTAIEEASYHYEIALKQYHELLQAKIRSTDAGINQNPLNLVKSNKNFQCTNYTVAFFRRRILNCLMNLESYESVMEWSSNIEQNSTNNLFSSNIDYSYLRSMNTFDVFDPCIQTNLESIDCLKQELLCDIEFSYHRMQNRLVHLSKEFYFDRFSEFRSNGSREKIVNEINDLIQNQLHPMLVLFNLSGFWSNDDLLNLQKIAFQLRSIITRDNFTSASIHNFCHLNIDSDLDHCINTLSWFRIFQRLINLDDEMGSDGSNKKTFDELLLRSASKARNTMNFDLAQELLFQYAQSTIKMVPSKPEKIDPKFLSDLIEELLQRQSLASSALNFCFETSKLFHATNTNIDHSIDILLKTLNYSLEKSADMETTLPTELSARMFLKLAKFIQIDSNSCDSFEFHRLQQQPQSKLIDEKIVCLKNCAHNENVVGKLMLLAVNICPSFAKSWYKLGDWSYRLGMKLIDNDDDDRQGSSNIAKDKQNNIIEFYKLAANSYMKFLHISTNKGCEDVDATLRLLRLILKHAPELREILESGLRETPSKPWKNITLQLFSRLNHHELYVRQSISELLCRIGSDSPHLVIFPAITGLLDDQIKSKNYDYTSTKEEEEYDDDDDECCDSIEQSLVKNCYASLLETLSQQDPNLISQTKLFVHELRRITVLWDELWIGILQHSLNEVKKQVEALEKEIETTKNNANLYENEKILFIKEQHNIFFRRILYSLKLTNMLTSDHPETPHEQWFQKNFTQSINLLIQSIQNPENINEPSNILYNYQNLFDTLRKRSMAAFNYRFQMQEISPKLAQLSNTVIPLPGIYDSSVTLKGIFKTVLVIQTQTKPKKIVFIGSDGRNHTYLFKGHEDLHLDERIMQLLSIVNKMTYKHRPSSMNNKLILQARHYSVTPLGNKSGLIQWVEGGNALYNLYKKWLVNRDISLDETTNKHATGVDLFRAKLLKHGVLKENRSEWNVDLLRKIHLELVRETPNDLISKELWCSSINPFDYWNLTQNFINSNAIMSVIGYVLGLGDRHLANILLDLTTGEVIHIDYNICFERGKSLHVPELVLCRLTQNIINALGITGVEGKFRISCENILKILRNGMETLLTLLESFVYDPLIDWTPEHEEGFTSAIYGGAKITQLANEGKIIPKKQMEKENQDAIERLKQLMKSVELRNTCWPKIGPDQMDNLEIITSTSSDLNVMKKDAATDNRAILTAHYTNRPNKRNAYALSVWKRIKLKLEGRDPYANKRLSVSEQVNHIIKDSISIENLSRMYEGWTSWV
ncbi:zinc finger CCCH domain-containing protein 18 [Sarcoptes scabiei]|nr:zinc finger CCCH domain-containing protein 18 [Sarcoptes scabiei]